MSAWRSGHTRKSTVGLHGHCLSELWFRHGEWLCQHLLWRSDTAIMSKETRVSSPSWPSSGSKTDTVAHHRKTLAHAELGLCWNDNTCYNILTTVICVKCRLLGHKNPVRTSQETHYVSATEPSQLILRQIWGFHGGDYEEWCLLGYKDPFRTSQETHYVSATEPSQLILCKIWCFHGGDYEECRLLGCYAVWLL
jgi:hypothetical protein